MDFERKEKDIRLDEIEWVEESDPNNDTEFEEFKNFYEFDLTGKDVALRSEKTDVMDFKRDFPGLWFDMMKQRIIYNIGENTLLILKKHKMLNRLMKCFETRTLCDSNSSTDFETSTLCDSNNFISKVEIVLNMCDEVASPVEHVFIQNSLNNLKNGIVVE